MALDEEMLSKLIIKKLEDKDFKANKQSRDVWRAIAAAIIQHFKDNAEVTTTDNAGHSCTGEIK